MKKEITDYDILISNYLDNNTTSQEKAMLTAWVKASIENETYFVEIAKAWEKSTIEVQNKENLRKQAEALLNRIKIKKQPQIYRWAIGTVAAIILLVAGTYFSEITSFLNNKMITVASLDTKKEIILPDKSIVWLNSNSTLKYPENFNRKRYVILTGEAFFDVRKEEEKPFSVNTSAITIEVKGTTFLITDREEDRRTEVILETGKIDVTLNTTDEKLQMMPNRQLIYNKDEKTTTINVVNAQNYTRWKNHRLVFESTPLQDVFTQLNKWYNTDITCNNKELLHTPVSFILEDEPLEEVLNILQQITSFTWKQTSIQSIIIE